ncbi:RNA-binding S4 domain-containing protein [Galactobacter valiniphilus]|uniref:RNA-binding S4 domain-containing protein n=1 Tax=Galactobacter valiniphilus TaxID=2676122 RepID=UPI0037352A32
MSAATPRIEDVLFAEEGIRLGQFLKFVGAVEDGQEAKAAIANGLVKLNGDIEERRGAQLAAGSVIEFNGQAWRIVVE